MDIIKKLRSQIGDDVQKVFDREALLEEAAATIERLTAERDAAIAEKRAYKDTANEIAGQITARARKAESERDALKAFVVKIAKQKVFSEVERPMDHDWIDGFEYVVKEARAALAKLEGRDNE